MVRAARTDTDDTAAPAGPRLTAADSATTIDSDGKGTAGGKMAGDYCNVYERDANGNIIRCSGVVKRGA